MEKARFSREYSPMGGRVSVPSVPVSETSEPEIDPLALRRALGNMPTVVTAEGPDGRRAAITANSFTSISLVPPLVSVCIANESGSIRIIRRSGTFAVHVLDGDQGELARLFAQRGPAKLGRMPFGHSRFGNPVLERYLLLLECDVYAEYPGGDHRIILGRVRDCRVRPQAGSALTFFQGRFEALETR